MIIFGQQNNLSELPNNIFTPAGAWEEKQTRKKVSILWQHHSTSFSFFIGCFVEILKEDELASLSKLTLLHINKIKCNNFSALYSKM